ncbi:hypothetical protein AB9P05_10440 [Roseivirga sp. BDSF3-8]|uniref:hypothetical protein n=1 Tax=Roseivirga sp. BDSF3-8 TaxID=3241598 RepID=UPI003532219D
MRQIISITLSLFMLLAITPLMAGTSEVTVQVNVSDYYSGEPVNEQLYITAENLDTGEVITDTRDRTLELQPGNYRISAEGVYARSATAFTGYIGSDQTLNITTYYQQ